MDQINGSGWSFGFVKHLLWDLVRKAVLTKGKFTLLSEPDYPFLPNRDHLSSTICPNLHAQHQTSKNICTSRLINHIKIIIGRGNLSGLFVH